MSIQRVSTENGYVEIYNNSGLSGKIYIGTDGVKSISQYTSDAVTIRDNNAHSYSEYDESGILIHTRPF